MFSGYLLVGKMAINRQSVLVEVNLGMSEVRESKSRVLACL
jgi:hypothetical protein